MASMFEQTIKNLIVSAEEHSFEGKQKTSKKEENVEADNEEHENMLAEVAQIDHDFEYSQEGTAVTQDGDDHPMDSENKDHGEDCSDLGGVSTDSESDDMDDKGGHIGDNESDDDMDDKRGHGDDNENNDKIQGGKSVENDGGKRSNDVKHNVHKKERIHKDSEDENTDNDDDDDDDDYSSDVTEYYDSDDEENFFRIRASEVKDQLLFHYNLYSDAETDIYDYGYEDSGPPKVVSPYRDSWDWTFKNTNISDLEVNFVAPSYKRGETEDSEKETKHFLSRRLPWDQDTRSIASETAMKRGTLGERTYSYPRRSFSKSSRRLSSRKSVRSSHRYKNYVHYKAFERAVRDAYKPTREPQRVFSKVFDGAPLSAWNQYERYILNSDHVVFFERDTYEPVKARLKFLFEDTQVSKCTRSDFYELQFLLDKMDPKRQGITERRKFETRNLKSANQRWKIVEGRFMTTKVTNTNDKQVENDLKEEVDESSASIRTSAKSSGRNLTSSHTRDSEKSAASRHLKPRRSLGKEVTFSKRMFRRANSLVEIRDLERRYGGLIQWKVFTEMTALEKFRHAIRMVILMLKAVGTKPEKHETGRYNFLSWTIVYDEVLGISRLNYDQDRLTFDPLQYKANTEAAINEEVKAILMLPPEERSDAQIRSVIVCFQYALPSFGEFPLKTQKAMLKVCRYEKFESGRVLIRQGHRAENFYFIISGRAVVTEMDSGGNHVHTANILGKGNSFGDLAFLNRSQRTATITCRDDVELLCLERSDFIQLFMRNAEDTEPDHVSYLRNLDLLKGWPMDKLPGQNPNICASTYVRRGVILCHDSATTDWIFIVAAGSCRVLKALHTGPVKEERAAPQALMWPHGRTLSQGSTSAHSSGSRRRHRDLGYRQEALVPPGSRYFTRTRTDDEIVVSQREHLSELESVFQGKHSSPDKEKTSSTLPELAPPKPSPTTSTAPTSIIIQVPNLCKPALEPIPAVREKTNRHARPPHTSKPSHDVLSHYHEHKQSMPVAKIPLHPKQFVPTNTPATRHSSFAHNPTPSRPVGYRPPRPRQLTAVTSHPLRMTVPDKVFIEMARLGPGDVFGMDQVLLGGMRELTSCSLVSSGAEVILLNKAFFKKHLTEETAKRIRLKVRPMPSEQVLRKNLATHKSWEAYKASTLASRVRTSRHHDSGPRWLQT